MATIWKRSESLGFFSMKEKANTFDSMKIIFEESDHIPYKESIIKAY
jgi:hypothetical protein